MVVNAGNLFAPDELEPMPAIPDFMERKELERQLDAVPKRRGSRLRTDADAMIRRPRPRATIVERLGEDVLAGRADVDAHPSVAGRHVRAVHLECRLDDADVAVECLD